MSCNTTNCQVCGAPDMKEWERLEARNADLLEALERLRKAAPPPRRATAMAYQEARFDAGMAIEKAKEEP